MSNALAIAGVTEALKELLLSARDEFGPLRELFQILGGYGVTSVSPKEADAPSGPEADPPNRVNVYLYRATPSAAFRNAILPDRNRAGERGRPPLGLELRYLISVYGEGKDETVGQLLLGLAMRILHDRPVLTREELGRIFAGATGLQDQLEEIKITPVALGEEESNRLWSIFGARYRLSAAYAVSVVLIDSELPIKAPQPVLRRGRPDLAGAGAASPETIGVGPGGADFPSLVRFIYPHGGPAATFGDEVTLQGTRIGPDDIRKPKLELELPRRVSPVQVDLADASRGTDEIRFVLKRDNDFPPERFPAGVWIASLRESDKDVKFPASTGSLPLTIAPRIAERNGGGLLIDVDPGAAPSKTVRLKCVPHVFPGQSVALILNADMYPAEPLGPNSAPSDSLVFREVRIEPGVSYRVRLRVDGVDSVLIDRTTSPPRFDASQVFVYRP